MSNPDNYFVTDIECDGLTPGESSMLSFATVAVPQDGHIADEFEAVLERLPGSSGDPETMAFWKTQPDAWKAATENPEPPEVVMPRFSDWVRTFSGGKAFASRPLMLDGPWIDYYLRKFANTFVMDDPFKMKNCSRQVRWILALTFRACSIVLSHTPAKCKFRQTGSAITRTPTAQLMMPAGMLRF